MMAKEIGGSDGVELFTTAAELKGRGWISIFTGDYMLDC